MRWSHPAQSLIPAPVANSLVSHGHNHHGNGTYRDSGSALWWLLALDAYLFSLGQFGGSSYPPEMVRKGPHHSPLTVVWCFYFYSAFFQFQYSVEHISGTHNTAADALSRNNLTLFSSLVPQAVKTDIPPAVVELLVTQRPDWGSPRWITLFKDTLPRH